MNEIFVMIGLCICCTFQEMPCISVDTNGKISSLFFLCLSVWQIVHFQQVFSIYLVGCRGVFFLGTASPLLSLHWMFLEVSTVSALLLTWDLNIMCKLQKEYWILVSTDHVTLSCVSLGLTVGCWLCNYITFCILWC